MMNQYSKMNQHQVSSYGANNRPQGMVNAGGGYNRWYDLDGPLSGSSASSGGGNSTSGMMGITNGLAGLGLVTGSPSSMSPNKGQGPPVGSQQQQNQVPPPPSHHVNGSGMGVMGEEERKMLRAIGTERSWKYGGGGYGGVSGVGPVMPPMPQPQNTMGMDADSMAMWMMLDKVAGGGGGVSNQQPQMSMHSSWMAAAAHNNNNSGNKSRPPLFLPEPELHLQDPYNVST